MRSFLTAPSGPFGCLASASSTACLIAAVATGCRSLPFFLFYRGAEGKVASFSCSVSKFARFREALDQYEAPFCNIEDIPELPEFPDVHAHENEK